MGTRSRSSSDIRRRSRLSVLHALLAHGVSTRAEVAADTGLSLATVATIVAELIEQGLVLESDAGISGVVGRPTKTLRMHAARGRLVGIDVAETYVRAVVFDVALTTLGDALVPVDEDVLDPRYLADRILLAVDDALAASGGSREHLVGVGLSLPGVPRSPRSGVRVAAPQWARAYVELGRLVGEGMPAPMIIENPLTAIATAEQWFGAGRRIDDLVVVNLGTGVGAGIVIDGELLRGSTDRAGEWGHAVLSYEGRGCRCGRLGCVEAYVGAPGIQQSLRDLDPAHPLLELHQNDFIQSLALAIAAPEPDPVAVATLERTADYLGTAIADLVAIVNPERILLTGWTSWALGEALLPAVRRRLLERSPDGAATEETLQISTVRGNPVAVGVATLALERFLDAVGLPTRAAVDERPTTAARV